MIIYDILKTNYKEVVEPNLSRTQVRAKLSKSELETTCPTHGQYKFRVTTNFCIYYLWITDNEEITGMCKLFIR
jgi:hypothetical protein